VEDDLRFVADKKSDIFIFHHLKVLLKRLFVHFSGRCGRCIL